MPLLSQTGTTVFLRSGLMAVSLEISKVSPDISAVYGGVMEADYFFVTIATKDRRERS